jgi:hypothetical protein
MQRHVSNGTSAGGCDRDVCVVCVCVCVCASKLLFDHGHLTHHLRHHVLAVHHMGGGKQRGLILAAPVGLALPLA